MRKRRILNICMVLTVLLAAVCGIMAVGSVKGWFDKDAEASALTITEKSGIAMVERSGIAYEIDAGTAVREGDVLYTKNASAFTIGDGTAARVSLDGNAEITIKSIEKSLSVEVLKGDTLFDGRNMENVSAVSGDTQVVLDGAVASVSTQAGATMVYVYAGDVALTRGEETATAKAGQVVTIVVGDKMKTAAFNANSLNDAQMTKLIQCGMDETFCFTKADIDTVRAEREAEKLKAQQELIAQQEAAKQEAIKQEMAEFEASLPSGDTQTETGSSSGDVGGFGDADSSGSGGSSATPAGTCTIEIRCDTILNNMENLTAGKEGYVPSNGTILGTTQVTFYGGETVFDVLQRVCSSAGIQLEYSWTPLYDSYYIEGINHLYEFDCGEQSGWMYKVNGWFPNYGCSSYDLSDGDTIVWCYTCVGLGTDVGGSNFG